MTGFSAGGKFDDVSDAQFEHGVISVSGTALECKVQATSLPNRQEVFLFNRSIETCYVGKESVLNSNALDGIPLESQESASFNFGSEIPLYIICPTGTVDVVILEVG